MVLSISKLARKKPVLTIAVWIIVALTLFVSTQFIQPKWIGDARLPNSESDTAMKLLEEHFKNPQLDGSYKQGFIVFYAKDGISRHQESIEKYLKKIQNKKGSTIERVDSPVDLDHSSQISLDGRTAFARVFFGSGHPDSEQLVKESMRDSAQLRKEIRVEFYGLIFGNLTTPHNEIYGIIAAVVILSIVFGSLVAAGLPILTAGIGVLVGLSIVKLLTLVMGVPETGYVIGAMMGIGVGIDYALFILTRYREELHNGKSQQDAIDTTMSTSGVAVFSAGATVVISILGILVVNIDYLNGLALATSVCVFFMIVMALTLIPALLATRVGIWLDKLPTRKKKNDQQKETRFSWEKWSYFVQKRSIIGVIIGVLILLLISSPILFLRIGVTDVGNESTKRTTRRAYDILANGFGPGFNGPLIIVVDQRKAEEPDALMNLMRDINNHPDIKEITPNPTLIATLENLNKFINGFIKAKEDTSGQPRDELRRNFVASSDKSVLAFVVYPKTAPQDERTTQLVHDLRQKIIPENLKRSGIRAYVTGVTAGHIDFAEMMSTRIPYFMGGVLIISFIFLLLTFRSILIAIKAIIMNILSISAAYGVVIAVFQFGWLSRLLGVGAPGPIEAWAPLLLFAILFGLSMDYEVFLISKMKEEYEKGHNNSDAVAKGLASTGRVITAAAFIMAFVFGSFAFAIDRPVKLMGLGLAAAVVIDATVIRMLLVPATMELLGDKNWWLPHWIDKRLPKHNREPISSGN